MWGYPEFYIPVPGGYGTESHSHLGNGSSAPTHHPKPALDPERLTQRAPGAAARPPPAALGALSRRRGRFPDDPDERLERYAELIVRVGANVQPGQQVYVIGERRARAARAGARPRRRTRPARGTSSRSTTTRTSSGRTSSTAPHDSLGYTPPQLIDWIAQLDGGAPGDDPHHRRPRARAALRPRPRPRRPLAPARARRRRSMPLVLEGQHQLGRSPPTRPRAGRRPCSASPTSSGSGTRSRRRRASTRTTRSPPGRRTSTSSSAAREALDERAFDAIRFRGPGTDLTVGLIPGASWISGRRDERRSASQHVPNMPTEEVFTTPDRRRAEGTVRSTLPLHVGGTTVHDLELRFEGGRIVEVERLGRAGDRRAAARHRRRRALPRRGRARRRRVGRPAHRARVPRHAVRRERDVPHRLRPGLPFVLPPASATTTAARRVGSTPPACTRTS